MAAFTPLYPSYTTMANPNHTRQPGLIEGDFLDRKRLSLRLYMNMSSMGSVHCSGGSKGRTHKTHRAVLSLLDTHCGDREQWETQALFDKLAQSNQEKLPSYANTPHTGESLRGSLKYLLGRQRAKESQS